MAAVSIILHGRLCYFQTLGWTGTVLRCACITANLSVFENQFSAQLSIHRVKYRDKIRWRWEDAVYSVSTFHSVSL